MLSVRRWRQSRFFAVIATVFWLSAAPGSTLAEPLIIGTMEDDFHKYSFLEHGEIKGVLVDVARRVFDDLGIEIRFQRYPWARLIEEMRSQEIDGILTVFRTRDRIAFMHYPNEPIMHEVNHLMLPKDSTIEFNGLLSSLDGLRIGTVRGWSHGEAFDNWHRFDKIPLNDQTTILRNLAMGRLHAGVGIKSDMLRLARELGLSDRIRFAETPVIRVPSFFAFSLKPGHEALARRFSDGLAALKRSGEYDAIHDAYGIAPE